MSLKAGIQHNQSLAAAGVLCLLIVGGFYGCHLTQPEKQDILDNATIVAEAVVQGNAMPWSTIGLLIGSILGAGAVIDNRRKDVVIKQEQKHNADKAKLLTIMVNGNGTNSTIPRPLCPN